jgi:hypothetical protein
MSPSLRLPGVGSLFTGSLTAGFAGLLRAVVAGFLTVLADPITRFVLHTPDPADSHGLRAVWAASLAVQLALTGLLVAVAGLGLVPGSRVSAAAREALTVRLPAGVATGVMALPLVALEASLSNTVTSALLPNSGGIGALLDGARGGLSGSVTGGLALLVTGAVMVVLLVGLAVTGLARFAVVWALIALAPIAMAAATLPGGAALARLWWRLQLAAVFLPVAEAVLVLTFHALSPVTGGTGIVGALAGVAVLSIMGKLPGWAGGAALGLEPRPTVARLGRRAAELSALGGAALGLETSALYHLGRRGLGVSAAARHPQRS